MSTESFFSGTTVHQKVVGSVVNGVLVLFGDFSQKGSFLQNRRPHVHISSQEVSPLSVRSPSLSSLPTSSRDPLP